MYTKLTSATLSNARMLYIHSSEATYSFILFLNYSFFLVFFVSLISFSFTGYAIFLAPQLDAFVEKLHRHAR